jgi:glycosyltransferase involved in cell wall biosynthesis/peptidoglycan/xylan/chitin deacetylase (PgdA/CDA1 family)
MRILIATDQWFPDVRGGVARLATESAVQLGAQGHEVTVLAPRSREGATAGEVAGLRVVRALRRGRTPQTLTDPIDTAHAARSLGNEFDVLLGHNSTTASGLANAGLDAPLVTFFHASAVLELEFAEARTAAGPRPSAWVLKALLSAREGRSLAGAVRILLLSEFTRALLASRSPEAAARATLVPGAVDTAVFSPGDRAAARERLGVEPGETVLFTARRLVPRMGLEELIDARALLSDIPRLRVAIAGDGPLRERLAEQSGAAGGGIRVDLLGRISDEALVDWYRAADLFVLPTLAYEGFGMATIEALASGTPVVGTPVGATPEILAPLEERLIADGSTPVALAEAIRRALALATPELRARCRAHALERYSWQSAIPIWEHELEAASHSASAKRRKGIVVRVAREVDRHVAFDLKSVRDRAVAEAREQTGLAVRATRLPALTRRLSSGRRAGILLYHNPEPETLDRHLAYLSEQHEFVPYSAVAAAVATGDWSAVPPKSLALTFDDGHAANVRLVPVLERYGAPATIFICTGIVGTGRRFWWTLDELDAGERDRLMNVPDAERLARLAELAGWTPVREYDGVPQALSVSDLEALAGRVSLEAHTRLHPILTMCGDEEAAAEIEGSKADVERLTGGSCTAFAYPNGRYGPRELDLVKRAGFRSARTIETGWNDPETDPFRLRVLGMPDNASLNVVAAQSTGLPFLRDLMYLS